MRANYHFSGGAEPFKQIPYRKHLWGDTCHALVSVEIEGWLLMIDWSAAQFGYREFPLLWEEKREGWQPLPELELL